MKNDHEQLAKLLRTTGKEHHKAFEEVDGHDPDWPSWYADRMHAEFESILNKSVGVAGLADLLARFDELHEHESPGDSWADYYASKLLTFYKD